MKDPFSKEGLSRTHRTIWVAAHSSKPQRGHSTKDEMGSASTLLFLFKSCHGTAATLSCSQTPHFCFVTAVTVISTNPLHIQTVVGSNKKSEATSECSAMCSRITYLSVYGTVPSAPRETQDGVIFFLKCANEPWQHCAILQQNNSYMSTADKLPLKPRCGHSAIFHVFTLQTKLARLLRIACEFKTWLSPQETLSYVYVYVYDPRG